MTKSRRYSTTFGALRQARAEWRQRGGRPAPVESEDQAPIVAGHHHDPDG
jgi:Replication initiator protein, pSAM2